jgi:CubicO group peptidase (beta-lactamase class C family)
MGLPPASLASSTARPMSDPGRNRMVLNGMSRLNREAWARVLLVGILLIGLVSCKPGRPNIAETALTHVAKIGPAIDALHADEVSGLRELRAALVSVDGEVVAERYYGSDPTEYADLQSVTKSIVSMLVGIAIGEGKISGVDATLEELLPQYRKDMDDRTRKTTLRQLLTMTAGWTDSDPAGLDLLRAWFREGPQLHPGEQFRYTNIGPHIVAHVLRRATGMSLLAYARQKLFDPLDIPTRPAYEAHFGEVPYWVEPKFLAADFAWLRAPDGIHAGSFALKLRAIDMLKLGQLYLDKGRWQGKQLVPADWIEQSTAADAPNGYGYFWWIHPVQGQHGYAAVGGGGQVILVNPGRQLVMVASSRVVGPDQGGDAIFRLVDLAVIPNLA